MSLTQIFETSQWLTDKGTAILIISIYGILSYLIFKFILWRVLDVFREKNLTKKDAEAAQQRFNTLNGTISRGAEVVIFTLVVVAILAEFGLNIAPLIAGLGIIGVAFGFGAQGLIKDIVNGALILAEGQYSVGDVVEISEKKGKVEKITLRRTVLRDLDGTVHHLPNSVVAIVSNKSQDWGGIDMDVAVSCKEDLDKVTAVLDKAGQKLYEDEKFAGLLLEPPKALGLESFENSKMIIKVLGRTKHLKRWEVEREFRRRIKEAFDKEKIKLV